MRFGHTRSGHGRGDSADMVSPIVGSRRQDFKVIVVPARFVAAKMVDDFGPFEWPAEFLFHRPTVRSHRPLTTDSKERIALPIKPCGAGEWSNHR